MTTRCSTMGSVQGIGLSSLLERMNARQLLMQYYGRESSSAYPRGCYAMEPGTARQDSWRVWYNVHASGGGPVSTLRPICAYSPKTEEGDDPCNCKERTCNGNYI